MKHIGVLTAGGDSPGLNAAIRGIGKGATFDNDVAMTDVTFGFDTAMEIATRAIDRLHSTAHSHHRIIVVEVMGHNTGWLALGSGIASGADVILIPEIPYDIHRIAEAIQERLHRGKNFSIVAVAEGAVSMKDHALGLKLKAKKKKANEENDAHLKKKIKDDPTELAAKRKAHTLHLSRELEQLTGLETRLTILGHLQRGGTPSATDRLLATRLGTACVSYLKEGTFGVMIGVRCEGTEPVPLAEVVGKRKIVPLNHPWVESARHVGTYLGD